MVKKEGKKRIKKKLRNAALITTAAGAIGFGGNYALEQKVDNYLNDPSSGYIEKAVSFSKERAKDKVREKSPVSEENLAKDIGKYIDNAKKEGHFDFDFKGPLNAENVEKKSAPQKGFKYSTHSIDFRYKEDPIVTVPPEAIDYKGGPIFDKNSYEIDEEKVKYHKNNKLQKELEEYGKDKVADYVKTFAIWSLVAGAGAAGGGIALNKLRKSLSDKKTQDNSKNNR